MNGTTRYAYRYSVEPQALPGMVWINAEEFWVEDGHWASRSNLSIPEDEIPALINFLTDYVDSKK